MTQVRTGQAPPPSDHEAFGTRFRAVASLRAGRLQDDALAALPRPRLK